MLSLIKPVMDWIFPLRCLVCHNDLGEGDICLSCISLCNRYPLSQLFKSKNDSAIFYFELVIRSLINEAKFNRSPVHMSLLFRLIKKEIIATKLIEKLKAFSPQAITAVPSHWAIRISRGVDLPFLFAATLARELGVPVISTLKKRKLSDRQSLRATRNERRAAIRGSLVLKQRLKSYERLLLVDDIVTTGATFDESIKVLRQIGGDVRCIAIAKTP
jgi:competence protein ComFC